MNDQRAIQATCSDWKTVKTRKVLQLVFEVPLENTRHVMDMLGTPMPDKETWVAIALLGAEPGRLKGGEWSQQAGILSQNPDFGLYAKRQGYEDPADLIRTYCGVRSRADLDHDAGAAKTFRELRTEFEQWKGGHAKPNRMESAA